MTDLSALKQEHFENLLKFFQLTNKSNDVRDYFEQIRNENDEIIVEKENKTNKKLYKQNSYEKQKAENSAKINKNTKYCEYCKKSYWNVELTSNFRAYTRPKGYISYQSAKLLAKSKLHNHKHKYKSYKQRIIDRIYKNGLKFVYKCKRCNKDNVMYKDSKRENIDKLRLVSLSKGVKSKTKVNHSAKPINSSTNFNSVIPNVVNIDTSILKLSKNNRKKKFESLKMTLISEQNKQRALSEQKTISKNSLADFLQQIK